MLETSIRQIAVQAIAARASGSPVEAAGQILAGIAALDSPGKPFVIWPTNLPLAEQIKALESELERIRHITQSMADYRAMRDLHHQADSGAHLQPQDTQSHQEAFDMPTEEVASQPIPGEAKEEAALDDRQIDIASRALTNAVVALVARGEVEGIEKAATSIAKALVAGLQVIQESCSTR